MRHQVPLWVAAAACLGGLALGGVRAQAPKEQKEQKPDQDFAQDLRRYPYLPAEYAEPFLPSVADWKAMQLTAVGASTTRFTQEFTRRQMSCFVGPAGLICILDLAPEPAWKYYAGGGKFSAPVEKVKPDLERAVSLALRQVKSFYPEVKDANVTIGVYLLTERVGSFENGKLTLLAESPPSK